MFSFRASERVRGPLPHHMRSHGEIIEARNARCPTSSSEETSTITGDAGGGDARPGALQDTAATTTPPRAPATPAMRPASSTVRAARTPAEPSTSLTTDVTISDTIPAAAGTTAQAIAELDDTASAGANVAGNGSNGSAGGAQSGGSGNAYERQRQQRIQENEQRMRSLNLQGSAEAVAAADAPARRAAVCLGLEHLRSLFLPAL